MQEVQKQRYMRKFLRNLRHIHLGATFLGKRFKETATKTHFKSCAHRPEDWLQHGKTRALLNHL